MNTFRKIPCLIGIYNQHSNKVDIISIHATSERSLMASTDTSTQITTFLFTIRLPSTRKRQKIQQKPKKLQRLKMQLC